MIRYCLLFLLFCHSVTASQLSVNVVDDSGNKVAFAAITLTPADENTPATRHHSKDSVETMAQINEQFMPYVLVISPGTKVEFPNRDNIKHHVYSFSEAKTFELELYDDFDGTPVTFENTGIVEVGCNIHDWMLAYIYVTDAPFYGATKEDGMASLTLPDGQYNARIWHPNLDRREGNKDYRVMVKGNTTVSLALSYPLLEGFDFSSGFSDY
ncbi:methylamine utilization protein [Alteromonas sediminis]|uniref:Methylamine utilization protein n=1 Tax=Alteromonas sediminis TaxID=2259342 RepID=A0A3N5Y8Q5_9ALTE|nr:methylamine utilization protein [Alteromonas sediminis]RPJ64845.1 methylamine utilization protein [Alteromonas sediminis]